MQSKILLTLLSTAATLFFSSVTAAPTAGVSDVVGVRAEKPTLEERQYYDGPCSNTDCGVNRVNCRNSGLWCVAYPRFDMPEGCTCSSL